MSPSWIKGSVKGFLVRNTLVLAGQPVLTPVPSPLTWTRLSELVFDSTGSHHVQGDRPPLGHHLRRRPGSDGGREGDGTPRHVNRTPEAERGECRGKERTEDRREEEGEKEG